MAFDAVLADYLSAVRRAARVRRPPAAHAGTPEVDAARLLWRRLSVTHAARRLPAGGHARAASGGLQDSAPRAALLALHARVEDVGPDGWEHPDLVQIWLRWADYVVPRADAGIFSLGARPRDEHIGRALDELGRAVTDAMPEGRLRSGIVADALGISNPSMLRSVAVTGRVLIRWDARTTEIVASPAPEIDVEDARRELARRFLHWLGPATADHFAKWAGVIRRDAEETWAVIRPELEPVAVGGRERWMLSADVDALVDASRPSGTRFLPQGDPCLYLSEDLEPQPRTRTTDSDAGITTRLLNSLTGRIVDDGEILGGWGRVGALLTIDAWSAMSRGRAEDVDRTAHQLSGPIGRSIEARWLPDRTS